MSFFKKIITGNGALFELNPYKAHKKGFEGAKDILGFGKNNDAADAAAEAEAERQRMMREAQLKIEGIFSSPERQKQIQDYIDSQRRYLQKDLDKEHAVNSRNLKFSTARSGLSGGSVDVDKNQDLSELYLRGIAEAERRAQNSGAQLKAQDQNAKQSLFSQILSGADATTAAQNAAQMLQTNTALAKQDSTVNAFDNLFSNFGDYNKNSRIAAGERRANRDPVFGTLFSSTQRNQGVGVAGGLNNPYSQQPKNPYTSNFAPQG